MSEVLDVFADHPGNRPGWWVILSCGHWYHWTGDKPPKQPDDNFPCPSCAPMPSIVPLPPAPEEK